MSAIVPEYTQPLLDGQEDPFEKEANISAHDSNCTTAGRSAASVGVATKNVSVIILAAVVLILINAMCITLVTRKTDEVFKALQGKLNFIDTRSLPRPDQFGL